MRIGFSQPNWTMPGDWHFSSWPPRCSRSGDDSQALIVADDQDQSPLSVRDPDWWADACLSPGWDVTTPLGKLRAQLALAIYPLAASRA